MYNLQQARVTRGRILSKINTLVSKSFKLAQKVCLICTKLDNIPMIISEYHIKYWIIGAVLSMFGQTWTTALNNKVDVPATDSNVF